MQTPPYRTRTVTEWFEEYENGVDRIFWYIQSRNVNPAEQLQEILDKGVQQSSPALPSK